MRILIYREKNWNRGRSCFPWLPPPPQKKKNCKWEGKQQISNIIRDSEAEKESSWYFVSLREGT